MSEFDPYLKWLGIRETARPINNYRLLGLELFESDKDVISMAADRQMEHIRKYQSGPNGKVSQKILNELARARRCLLVEEKKIAYDTALRAKLDAGGTTAPAVAGSTAAPATPTAKSAAPPVIQPMVVESGASGATQPDAFSSGPKLDVRTDPNAREKTKSRERTQLLLSLVGWVSGGLAALGVGAFLLGTGILTPKVDDPIDDGDNGRVANQKLIAENDPEGGLGGTEPVSLDDSNNSNGTNSDDPNSNKIVIPDPANSNTTTNTNSSPSAPSFEMPVVWKIEDASKYPKPNSAERGLLSILTADLAKARVGKIGSSAASTAGTKQQVSGLEHSGLMIGVVYQLDSDHKIKKLQPVLRTSTKLQSASMVGAKSLLAKPGYAVGEVQASVLSPMNCVRLRYMKVNSRGLDPDDSYFSTWIGCQIGPVTTIANPLNAPIVGTFSDVDGKDVAQTFGLMAAHSSLSWSGEEKPNDVPVDVPDDVIVGQSLPVISRSPVASSFFTSGAARESIVFVNKLDDYVSVYKIDEKLNLRNYLRIRPGSSFTASAVLGTNWHIKKGTVSIATFRTAAGKNTAIIDNRDPDGALPKLANLEKKRIPSSSDKNAAMKEVTKIYGDLLSNEKRNPVVNRRNAESLIDDARDSGEDLAMQYMMFETAKDLALSKGDCRTAMLALRELDRHFEDFDFWDEAVSAVHDSGKSLARTGDRFMGSELEAVLKSLIDEAIREGEPRSASKLVSFGRKVATRNGDSESVKFFKAKEKESSEVAKLQKQYESAIVKLAVDPENPNANIQKGRYLIVTRGDFEGALECWEHSEDERLLAIVNDEASNNANASFLSQRWQTLGKDPSTAFGRRCFGRAIEILESAGKSRQARDLRKLLEE